MTQREQPQTWPDAVRERAEQLARDPELSASEVRSALSEELSADVPLSTVARWVRELRRLEPIDRQALLRHCADRASVLLAEELTRLERLPSKSRDLQRLDAVIRSLKQLGAIEISKGSRERQTLAGLSAGSREPDTSGQRLPRAELSAV